MLDVQLFDEMARRRSGALDRVSEAFDVSEGYEVGAGCGHNERQGVSAGQDPLRNPQTQPGRITSRDWPDKGVLRALEFSRDVSSTEKAR